MRAILLLLLLLGMAAVPLPATARGGVRHGVSPVSLAHRFRDGVQVTLRTSVTYGVRYGTSQSPRTEQDQDAFLQRLTVDRVYGDGSALVRLRFARVQVRHDGALHGYGAPAYAVDDQLSARGVLLHQEHTNGENPLPIDLLGDPLSQMLMPEVPGHPVAVGDHWPVGLADPSRATSSALLAALHPTMTLQALRDGVATLALRGRYRPDRDGHSSGNSHRVHHRNGAAGPERWPRAW